MSLKNKKKSVKFVLAPRPQRDPLAADIDAPQHVLVPKGGLDIHEVKQRLPDFDEKLFTSQQETKVGMLERAHQNAGITFDPELLDAMGKDFDYDNPNNVLDDDFMEQAGGLIEEDGEILDGEMTDIAAELFEDEPEIITFNKDRDNDYASEYSSNSDDYDLDQLASNEATGQFDQGRRLILFKSKAKQRVAEEERKGNFNADDSDDDDEDGDNKSTVFTNYSMTSSVMRRNQGLQQIDEHFERLFEKEYADDTEIGALDLNEVKGGELLTSIDQIRQMKKEVKEVRKRNHGDDYVPEIVSDHHKNAIIGEESDGEEDLVEVEIHRRENRIDCESILSYNSNLYNHPKLIVEPRRRTPSQATSTHMDVDDTDVRSRSGKSQSIASTRATIVSKLSFRPDNETPIERKARKKALKAYRQERRQERKQNQQIFKSEQANLIKQQNANRPALKLA